MLVLDASAAIDTLLGRPETDALSQRLLGDGDFHAPHLIDIEVLSALRRMVRKSDVTADRANDARFDFADLLLVRYPHQDLSARIWELRNSITAYDAAYVALAEVLEVPLITCDARLAGTMGHSAKIELFAE